MGLLATIVLSCSLNPHSSRPDRAPSFDRAAAASYGIAIGGIALAYDANIVDAYTEWEFATLVRFRILEKWKNIDPLSIGQVERALGTKTFEEIIDGYRATGSLEARDVLTLHDNVPARYLLYGRVERDMVLHNDNDTGLNRYDVWTSRMVVVSFKVYDTATGELVYNDRIMKRDEISDEPYGADPYEKYPPPPDVEELMVGLVDSFVSRLFGRTRQIGYRGYPSAGDFFGEQ